MRQSAGYNKWRLAKVRQAIKFALRATPPAEAAFAAVRSSRRAKAD